MHNRQSRQYAQQAELTACNFRFPFTAIASKFNIRTLFYMTNWLASKFFQILCWKTNRGNFVSPIASNSALCSRKWNPMGQCTDTF